MDEWVRVGSYKWLHTHQQKKKAVEHWGKVVTAWFHWAWLHCVPAATWLPELIAAPFLTVLAISDVKSVFLTIFGQASQSRLSWAETKHPMQTPDRISKQTKIEDARLCSLLTCVEAQKLKKGDQINKMWVRQRKHASEWKHKQVLGYILLCSTQEKLWWRTFQGDPVWKC